MKIENNRNKSLAKDIERARQKEKNRQLIKLRLLNKKGKNFI